MTNAVQRLLTRIIYQHMIHEITSSAVCAAQSCMGHNAIVNHASENLCSTKYLLKSLSVVAVPWAILILQLKPSRLAESSLRCRRIHPLSSKCIPAIAKLRANLHEIRSTKTQTWHFPAKSPSLTHITEKHKHSLQPDRHHHHRLAICDKSIISMR